MTASSGRGTALAQLARAEPAKTVPEVIARLEAIDAALPAADGVAWFTKLYLEVTKSVEASVSKHAFGDAHFLPSLDVVFANLFFSALEAFTTAPARTPKAWLPLIQARSARNIAPMQFALAGMNAHINRDLPVALVATFTELRLDLEHAPTQHAQFEAVNGLLAQTEQRVKHWFATGFAGVVDEAVRALAGKIDDRIAIWDVGRARDAAWVQAETLWALRGLPVLEARYLETLDHVVGFAGRGLLVPLS